MELWNLTWNILKIEWFLTIILLVNDVLTVEVVIEVEGVFGKEEVVEGVFVEG